MTVGSDSVTPAGEVVGQWTVATPFGYGLGGMAVHPDGRVWLAGEYEGMMRYIDRYLWSRSGLSGYLKTDGFLVEMRVD